MFRHPFHPPFSRPLLRRCPASGRIRGLNPGAWPAWILMIAGALATAWYLVRVIPRPARAAYPCQRAASPLRAGFFIYAAALVASVASFRWARISLLRSRLIAAGALLALSAGGLLVFLGGQEGPLGAAPLPTAPIGQGRGIFPGRVAWVHNPEAARWTGTGSYWDPAVNPQAEYDRMVPAALRALSGADQEPEAWRRIFTWFNEGRGAGKRGYRSGEKIAIKINCNNSTTHQDPTGSDANPAPIVAMIRSLVQGAGVPQACITVGDPSRAVANNVYRAVHGAFPEVRVVDFLGTEGRQGPEWIEHQIPEIAPLHTGLAKCFVEATYIINLPLLKGHVGQGITFGAKNFYGATHIDIDWRKSGGHPGTDALRTFMLHRHLGAKTLLWCMDATYPNPNLDGLPPAQGWPEAPFNGRPCSSLFVSLDGCAEESVSLDFFYQHYPGEVDAASNEGVRGILGSQKYIEAAARAGGGAFEHWNNGKDRQYSRNLDPKGGRGIELVYLNAAGPRP